MYGVEYCCIMSEINHRKAIYNARGAYLGKWLTFDRYYMSLSELYEFHLEAKKLCLEEFEKTPKFGDQFSKFYREELERYCESSFYHYAVEIKNRDFFG